MISPVPDQPDLLFLLHDIARLLRVAGDRRARAHGMTRAQWVILWQVQRQPGLSQKELAEIMDVEPITVARLVDRLAARGMVERRDDPADRRIWRLHLLPPAYPVLDHMRGERDEVIHRLGEGLADATLEAMRQSLIAMKANILAELRTRPAEAAPRAAPTASERPASKRPAVNRPAVKARPPARRRIGTAQPPFQQDRP
ncbi:MAG: MarR family transcriptional regulator [Acetobacteraceae bacterium]|nr:MarR family transcriptional regulator [Acetobacteraceae bacterium]